MKRVKLMVGVGLIFCLGALAGFFMARQMTHQKIRRFVHGGPPASMVIARMVSRIDLTPQQRQAIDPLLAGLRGELVEFHDRTLGEVNTIILQRYHRIADLLTPAQRQLLLNEAKKTRRFNLLRNSWRLPWADKSPDEVMAELTTALSLTPAQQDALAPLVARRVAAQKAVARMMLTAEGVPFREYRAEAMAKGGGINRSIQSVLTPEQLEAYWTYRTGNIKGRPRRFRP
ncbi:hypothetical protein [Desulfoluna spongiiphila]|uniref:hypothetical protein n=1 Tax=Desulfoluna spongiiphila TaxID=419481 RepID=UPI001259FDF1|nr:hypothetical protein [Desulfoluna spongiiphila]VVS93613.1 hypothetical protein DBB_31850 [Desulfoluna spongiiphila]